MNNARWEMNRLEELRKEIDNIDSQISSLLVKRFEKSLDIAEVKANMQKHVYDPDRERLVLENVLREIEDKTFEMYVHDVYKKIIELSKDIQHMRFHEED